MNAELTIAPTPLALGLNVSVPSVEGMELYPGVSSHSRHEFVKPVAAPFARQSGFQLDAVVADRVRQTQATSV